MSARCSTPMAQYAHAFLRFDPRALRRTVLLNLATALTEGTGLLMLVPLLSLAGVLDPAGNPNNWRPLRQGLAFLGARWNLETALLAFVALIAAQSLLTLLRDRAAHRLQLRFTDHLRKTLYAAIARSRWGFLTGLHSGELTGVLTGEVQRIGAGTYYLLRLLTLLVLVLTYAAVALSLSAWLTLLALASGATISLLLHGADRMARQSGTQLTATNRTLSRQVQEFLSAMKLIKLHGEETASLRTLWRLVDEISDRSIRFQHARTRMQAAYRIGGAVALAALCYAALVWLRLPAAHFLVMIAIFARLLPQFAELQNGRQQLLHMLPAFAAWHALMEACAAHRDPAAPEDPRAECPRTALAHAISFEGVGFSHPQSNHALSIEHLAIPARRTTAILGASGAGKTTLLDLLSGLLAPDRGAILIDGVPLQQLPGWRRGIAYVPQETPILHGTLRDNLMWGNPEACAAEIERALAQASLAEWVCRLPQGLDTEVGERGVRLSGGERQRLALARALLKRPAVLVLDEPTSALDAENQRAIADALRALRGEMTVLVVTHRHEQLADVIDGVVRVAHGAVGPWQATSALPAPAAG